MLAGGPTGLYGHVEQNRRRSLLLFAGFIVAIEIMAFVILVMPTMILDWPHCPLVSPRGYVTRYVLPVALVGLLIYAVKYWWFVGAVQKAVGFRYVDDREEPRFCGILEPLAISAGIATPSAAVIDGPALNAFACGVRADRMVVVATRGLIDGLDDDELAAVLAHEVIHIRNRDTLLLASANVFMDTLTMARGGKQVAFDDWRQMLPLLLLPVLCVGPLPLLRARTFRSSTVKPHTPRRLVNTGSGAADQMARMPPGAERSPGQRQSARAVKAIVGGAGEAIWAIVDVEQDRIMRAERG